MIARLTGRCVHADADSIVLDVGGVGYLVRATTSVIAAAARADDELSVHVHTSVREDAIQLFGFASRTEQVVFEQLVQLQGVGPKVAIAVLSAISPHDLQRATQVEDVTLLQSVPGVGPKVARRIVTELRDRIDSVLGAATTTLSASVSDVEHEPAFASLYEAREALVGLGLTVAEAEHALADTDDAATAEERIRQALTSRARSRA